MTRRTYYKWRRRNGNRYNNSSVFDKILWLVLKPPTWLLIAVGVILVGSVIFHFDPFYWINKVSAPYQHKFMGVITSILSAVIPGVGGK